MSLTNIDCAIGMAGLPDESIDVIFTDPPYVGDQYEAAYQVLADHAARLLKPSGFLVTYAGQYHLDRVMQILGGGGALLVLDGRAAPHGIGIDHPSAQSRLLLEADPDLAEATGFAKPMSAWGCCWREMDPEAAPVGAVPFQYVEGTFSSRGPWCGRARPIHGDGDKPAGRETARGGPGIHRVRDRPRDVRDGRLTARTGTARRPRCCGGV